METTGRLLTFFKNRNILVEELQFQLINAAYARLKVYTHIEKDRVMRTSQLLKQLDGVNELQRLEAR